MIIIKSDSEIELMRESNHRLEKVFDAMEKMIRPGISTWEIDQAARELIAQQGGIPNFLNYEGFPAAVCTSVNEEVVHHGDDYVFGDGLTGVDISKADAVHQLFAVKLFEGSIGFSYFHISKSLLVRGENGRTALWTIRL